MFKGVREVTDLLERVQAGAPDEPVLRYTQVLDLA